MQSGDIKVSEGMHLFLAHHYALHIGASDWNTNMAYFLKTSLPGVYFN